VSDIGDIADMQNSIYNELSEIEQTIRLSGHPTLVKSIDTEASAGAGAIINMSNDLDPGLRPSLLQPSGQSIDMILNSIENKVKMIDRMAHMGSVRAIETRSMSGIALQTEMLQLDTKLIEKSHSLELGEEQLWRLNRQDG
jgi:nitrogen-specific signal transduction histidine kinase